MKTSSHLGTSDRQSGRYVPPGVHRIGLGPRVRAESSERSRAGSDTGTHVIEHASVAPASSSTTSRIRPIARHSTESRIAALLAKLPRSNAFAPSNVALVVSVVAVAARWFADNAWTCALVSLVPLLFLLVREQRATWSMHAGMLWLALAWTGLVHRDPADTGHLHGLLSLFVMAVIMVSLHHAYKNMQELSRRDPLTGLLNRRGFEEFAKIELRRAARYSRPISFALLDVDRFKEINDRFGHAAGDRVLQLVAAQLGELRNSDLAVRLGGDEFGLLMPETDGEGAEQLVERLLQRIEERVQELGWPVTLSVGVADSQTPARHLDVLISQADQRMYDTKAIRHARAL